MECIFCSEPLKISISIDGVNLVSAHYRDRLDTLSAIKLIDKIISAYGVIGSTCKEHLISKAVYLLEYTGASLTEKGAKYVETECGSSHKSWSSPNKILTPIDDTPIPTVANVNIDLRNLEIGFNVFFYKGKINNWVNINPEYRKNMYEWIDFPNINKMSIQTYNSFKTKLDILIRSNSFFYEVNGEIIACIL